ncbi:hypothetical protein [Acinetobacter junii]|uniref:hypothetical protein n=1 Tax=Acinetobacter junii TaxID=40215 RepID=UPI003018C608
MTTLTIKIGSSFAVPIQFYDTETKLGMAITDDMVITAQIVNAHNEVIAIPNITTYPDQVNDAGFILFEVPALITKSWKAGSAQFDIKLTIGENVRHSNTIQFQIIKSITP